MPQKSAAIIVTEGQLRLSKAPTAELAAGALRAQEVAGLEAADFLVVAVQPGSGDAALDAVRAAARDAPLGKGAAA